MKLFRSDRVRVPLPEGHRFPMAKYSMLARAAETAALPGVELVSANPATVADLARVHDADYLGKLAAGTLGEAELRRIGFPWSKELWQRSALASGATIDAARAALAEGVAFNLAGGTHHAFPGRGEGYCLLNDVAIAVRALRAEGEVGRVVVIDCDAHQGNGTAFIFRDDDTVFTYSIHAEKNFPVRKESSDLDVGLPDGANDDAYLSALRDTLPEALDAARANLAVYLAGSDPYEGDQFGHLGMSKRGLALRDAFVFDACAARGLPVAVTMAGGYARRIEDTVDIQLETIRVAMEFAATRDCAGCGRRYT